MTLQAAPRPPVSPGTNGHVQVALPEPGQSLSQDAEWCVVRVGAEWLQIRFHDYKQLFSVPGLYEKVFYDILECTSPQTICDMVAAALCRQGASADTLRVLDLGAGNGIMGELMAGLGAEAVVGIDIIEEAARAAQRDRPGIYDRFHVVDLTNVDDADHRALAAYRFNCLTCVAALGFGDIPTDAFTTAFNLIRTDGWIAFNIKEAFLDDEDTSGFAQLVQTMTSDGVLDVCETRHYMHRLGTDRKQLPYIGIVGRKRRDIV
jgi:SAM-dependent methyltransferase